MIRLSTDIKIAVEYMMAFESVYPVNQSEHFFVLSGNTISAIPNL